MIPKVQKWGNSQGIRVSELLLAESGIEVGDAVKVFAGDDIIMVRAVRRMRRGHDLREMVSRLPEGTTREEGTAREPTGGSEW